MEEPQLHKMLQTTTTGRASRVSSCVTHVTREENVDEDEEARHGPIRLSCVCMQTNVSQNYESACVKVVWKNERMNVYSPDIDRMYRWRIIKANIGGRNQNRRTSTEKE